MREFLEKVLKETNFFKKGTYAFQIPEGIDRIAVLRKLEKVIPYYPLKFWKKCGCVPCRAWCNTYESNILEVYVYNVNPRVYEMEYEYVPTTLID